MSLPALATRRRVTIGMAAVTMLLFGAIGLGDLKVNLLPDLSFPTLTIRTEYVGAAPSEIETLVTEPIEELVGVVKNVRRIASVSRSGMSDVILEFAWGTDMDQASLEVREKLEVLQLPFEVQRPQLLRFDPSTEPILRLALSSTRESLTFDEAELKRLRRYADEELKRGLESIQGVAAVKVSGGLADEIHVDLDQERLKQLRLSAGQVIDRLRAENVNISGGRIDEGAQRYLVRTVNQFQAVEDIADLLIRVEQGVPLRLRDIATVRHSYREREAIIRMDGREAVEIAIYKEGDANTVTVADEVVRRIGQVKDGALPFEARLDVVDNQALFIRQALVEVRNAALIGGMLAVLVIWIFLRHAWTTFIVALSLPISIVTTFFFMGQFGLTLNIMSLGGLALATGMVVDSAIVVLENIARRREQGDGVVDAAVHGASEVAMAVTASVLTTVSVFLPLVFVEGVAGQLFKDQALTVTFAMLVSLLVALTLIPMLASLVARSPAAFADEPPPAPWQPRRRVVSLVVRMLRFLRYWLISVPLRLVVRLGLGAFLLLGRLLGLVLRPLAAVVMYAYDAVARGYDRLLPRVLERRASVLGLAALALAASLSMVPGLGLDLIPQFVQDRFEVTVRLPPGTALARTDAMVADLQRKQSGSGPIRTIYGVSGSGTRLDTNPTEAGENIGRLLVVLQPGAGERGEQQAMDLLRVELADMPGVEARFSRPELFDLATPLEVEIIGHDLDRLREASATLTARMQRSQRFADIKSSVEQGHPEIQILFDHDRAAALGLTTRQIADQVVRKVRGEVATRYSFRDRRIDVLVRASEDQRASVEDVRNLVVNPQSERPLPLSAVAEVIATEGPGEIRRVNQQRVAVVSANLAWGDLGSAVAEIEQLLAEGPLAAGVGVRIAGQSEELDASVRSFLFALGLAIFLVYLVMASQFESLLHPFVILFTIPLALVGVVLALKITGLPLSVIAFIGLIMLAGIVVNNAIVLIDRINQLRVAGSDKRDAIIEAARARFRPIVMTTLTTLIAFLPMALGTGEGAEMRRPLAVTVIGGLSLSAILTLVVIPVMYDLLDRKSDEAFQRLSVNPAEADLARGEAG
ncbi:MAG TPA: efflux RND transporter permease subunit [Xanthomonadaceae bacterium]|nr:efflux RND transporter permease subunit [Xanthomonadaceae bacterium]